MNFETFKKHADFRAVNSGGLDSYKNYRGPDFAGWLCGPSRSRDSDTLTDSNFESALTRLGGESESVQVNRFGHWACGYYDQILVKADSDKARELYAIYLDLERYPVLDDSDFSEREYEYQSDYANGAKKELASALSKHFGVKAGPKLEAIAFDLNMECQMQYGNDSCIDVYDCRDPDARDLERLKDCLSEIEHQRGYEKSRVYRALYARVESRLSELQNEGKN